MNSAAGPEPMTGCTIGIDLGTTNLKAALFDSSGRLHASSERPLRTERPARHRVEQDPDEWWQALRDVLTAVVEQAPTARVAGIAICAQVGSHVFVDDSGRALGKAWLWQDARCQASVAALSQRTNEADRLPSGLAIDNASVIARVHWLMEAEPETWKQVRYVLNPKDYLNARLVGEVATDGMSQYGLVDDAGSYYPGLDLLVPGLQDALPPVRDFRTTLGVVRPFGEDALDRAIAGAVVAVGNMDAFGNLFGSGAYADGAAIEVAGTCEIIGVLSSLDRSPQGVVKFAPVDGVRLYAGPTKAGGSAVQWVSRLLGVSVGDLMGAVAASSVSSEPLVFQPYLEGERAPVWDDNVRGSFVGLSGTHGTADLGRAVVEGVAMSARHLLEAAEASSGRTVRSLRLSGGGSQSDIGCQIRADVMGRPIERLAVRNSGVLGAALIGAIAAGTSSDIAQASEQLVHVDRVFEPDERNRTRVEALYQIYRNLYPALGSVNDSLTRVRLG